MAKQSAYLDYAAATPIAKEVLMTMQPYLSDRFYNPSALYNKAREVRHAVNEARASVSRDIGARPGEIVFTAGGTEADNLAIHGIMTVYPGKNLLISAVEHEAVREPAAQYAHKEIPVSSKGDINLVDLKRLINDDTVLISVMLANNEVGTIQPIKEVVAVVEEVRRGRIKRKIMLPLYVHTDACQAASHLDIHVARLGVDLMTMNGGKIYGPKQSGVLYVRAGINLSPLIRGGGQENGNRSGTENVAGIIGFSKALSIARTKANSERKRLKNIRDWFVAELQTVVPEVVLHGHPKSYLPHTVSFAIPGVDNERLMMMLDENGYMVATGSACSASSQEASLSLKAMGVSDDLARSTLRLSFGRSTTRADLSGFIDCLVSQLTDIKKLF